MHLDPFELHRPTSLEEAVGLARSLAGAYDFLAGGTDLLPNYKMHLNTKPHLISLDRLPELGGLGLGRLGAMARLEELRRHEEVARAYPALIDAATAVATPLVRASATVGGNLLLETRCFFFNQSLFWRQSLGYCLKAEGDRCHVVPQKTRCYATFSGDLAPALLVLGAEVELAGPEGSRRIPLADLYDREGDGIRRLRMKPGEILVAVHLPPSAGGLPSAYLKLRIRPSFDFPELGIAVACVEKEGRLEALKVAAGGLETYPRRFDAITDRFLGAALDPPGVDRLAAEVAAAVRPVHNTTLDPAYRKRMTGVFLRRALARARARGGVGG